MEGKSKLPIIALSLDIAAAVSFLLGIGCFYSVVLMAFGLLFFLLTVILPVVAVITGIAALCLGKKQIGARGVFISVTAIAAPIILVVVLIILFSTGVAVIHWM